MEIIMLRLHFHSHLAFKIKLQRVPMAISSSKKLGGEIFFFIIYLQLNKSIMFLPKVVGKLGIGD